VKTCSDRVMVAIFSVRLQRLWRQPFDLTLLV
jgi:hypothetical protein